MALTEVGRSLTEQHRLAQLAIGANAAITSESLWEMLDPHGLDRTRGRWVSASVMAAEMSFRQSQDVAQKYVTSYRAVEVPGASKVVVVPYFDRRRVARDLELAGPMYIKSLIGRGYSPAEAHSYAFSRMLGVGRKHAMDGGRGLIDATSSNDRRAIGYRRVTGADPCTFCAMLASRGAMFGSQRAHSVYSSEQTALVRSYDGGRYHLHCACTAEIVYGHWEPTSEEQKFIDAYERAVHVVDAQNLPRTQENVLGLMRADDTAGFRDNLARRRKTPVDDDG